MLFVPYNTKKLKFVCRLENNHKCKSQINLLMITDGNKRYYIAISSLPALLRRKSSNHDGDFYCLNCFNSYSTKNRFKEHGEISNKHDSCLIKCLSGLEKY